MTEAFRVAYTNRCRRLEAQSSGSRNFDCAHRNLRLGLSRVDLTVAHHDHRSSMVGFSLVFIYLPAAVFSLPNHIRIIAKGSAGQNTSGKVTCLGGASTGDNSTCFVLAAAVGEVLVFSARGRLMGRPTFFAERVFLIFLIYSCHF